MWFKEALSRKALELNGALGKLIKKGTIDEPLEVDRSGVSLAGEFKKADYMEDVKAYWNWNMRWFKRNPSYTPWSWIT
jgi:hypothetical protein